MIDLQTVLIFIPIALALNLTPGADMLFCFGQGLKSGPKEGVAASLGIATGAFIHSLAAGLGLAALITTNPLMFELIRWSGVAYLIWLALSILRKPLAKLEPHNIPSGGAFKAWRDGTLVCLLNPKILLFILAIIPQFITPSHGPILTQFLIFGAILNIGGTIINAVVGITAGSLGKFLTQNESFSKVLQYATSFIFISLAAKLAFDKK